MHGTLSKYVCFLLNLFVIINLAKGQRRSDFLCPLPSGQFPDVENCRIFHQCAHNVSYRFFCPPGSLYDGERNECVNRHEKVKCGPQPTTVAPTTTPDPNAAVPCDPIACKLPYCYCSNSGTDIPGGLLPEETPQMIMITFDGAVNHLNYEIYNTIFLDNRTNPNGCPIKGTFMMTHDYSDYSRVEDLYSNGHEMAVATVSRRKGLENEEAEAWVGEMVTMREILANFAAVDPSTVLGMRAPHLRPGRNAQYEVIYDYGFVWDSSIVVPPVKIPVWPYTLDYEISHECRSGSCPTSSFPGIWEVPMNSHYNDDRFEGGFCPYLDQCGLNFFSEDDVLNWLKDDFHRHYNTNKAPYMISVSVNWFNTPNHHQGLLKFIDYTLSLNDVYYTTMTEAVQWVSNPRPLSELSNYAEWDCSQKPERKASCALPNTCPLVLSETREGVEPGAGGTRYMKTCARCPVSAYPWIFDSRGQGHGTKDTYEKTSFLE